MFECFCENDFITNISNVKNKTFNNYKKIKTYEIKQIPSNTQNICVNDKIVCLIV